MSAFKWFLLIVSLVLGPVVSSQLWSPSSYQPNGVYCNHICENQRFTGGVALCFLKYEKNIKVLVARNPTFKRWNFHPMNSGSQHILIRNPEYICDRIRRGDGYDGYRRCDVSVNNKFRRDFNFERNINTFTSKDNNCNHLRFMSQFSKKDWAAEMEAAVSKALENLKNQIGGKRTASDNASTKKDVEEIVNKVKKIKNVAATVQPSNHVADSPSITLEINQGGNMTSYTSEKWTNVTATLKEIRDKAEKDKQPDLKELVSVLNKVLPVLNAVNITSKAKRSLENLRLLGSLVDIVNTVGAYTNIFKKNTTQQNDKPKSLIVPSNDKKEQEKNKSISDNLSSRMETVEIPKKVIDGMDKGVKIFSSALNFNQKTRSDSSAIFKLLNDVLDAFSVAIVNIHGNPGKYGNNPNNPANSNHMIGENYPPNSNPTIGEEYPPIINPMTGEEYPSNSNPMMGETYPSNSNPTMGGKCPHNTNAMMDEGYPHNTNPITGEKYPSNSNPMMGEKYPHYPNPMMGEEYPYNPKSMMGEKYPSNPNPMMGGTYPHNTNPMMDEEYPHNTNPMTGEKYPSNPNPMMGGKYPHNTNPMMDEEYPSSSSHMIGEGYPHNPNSMISQGYPFSSSPMMGEKYPHNTNPMMDEEYPSSSDHMIGEGYPHNPNSMISQGYPFSSSPIMGEKYPHNPNSMTGGKYPFNSNPMMGEKYPHNPNPMMGEGYPYNSNPITGQGYPSNSNPMIGETYTSNSNPMFNEKYPSIENPNTGNKFPIYPNPMLGEKYVPIPNPRTGGMLRGNMPSLAERLLFYSSPRVQINPEYVDLESSQQMCEVAREFFCQQEYFTVYTSDNYFCWSSLRKSNICNRQSKNCFQDLDFLLDPVQRY